MGNNSPSLDPNQLVRIESVHRGFFYQHLYSAVSLLRMQKHGVAVLEVERDEDVELQCDHHRIFVQVKTRNVALQPNDIASALARYEVLAAQYRDKKRDGTFEYWIVANSDPSPSLEKVKAAWPSNLHLSTPSVTTERSLILPVPAESVDQLLAAGAAEADLIPAGALSGETLILKLAACVQAASAGMPPWTDHRFSVDDLPSLFEQVIVQLQTFPATPVPYLGHDEEPKYETKDRVRLITGHSGSGKTSWASEASMYITEQAIYFDIGDASTASLPAAIARELCARLYSSGADQRTILRSGNTGLDSLRALNIAILRDNRRVALFLDNCQRVEPEAIVSVIESLSELKVVAIAQPSPREKALASLLTVSSEMLSGWSIQVIATHFARNDCPIDLVNAERIRRLTGGLPLYVLNMAKLAVDFYERDVVRLCGEIEKAVHPMATAQELILARVFDALGVDGRIAAASLYLSDVSLKSQEAREVVAIALEGNAVAASRAIRMTTDWSVVNLLRDSSLVIHDAFRVLIAEETARFSSGLAFSIRSRLKEMMLHTMSMSLDLSRYRFFIRLLPLLGQVDELVNLATSESEAFRELGLIGEAFPVLLEAARSEKTSVVDQIWAYDTLAMWANKDEDIDKVDQYVREMERLAATNEIPRRLAGEIESKRMLRAGRAGDIRTARIHLNTALELSVDEPDDQLILRYNFANAACLCQEYAIALQEADSLISDYYKALGLRPQDVIGKNPPEIFARIVETDEANDYMRRLADCLSMYCKTLQKTDQFNPLMRLHAHKFYVMSQSLQSAAESGKEVVEDFLSVNLPLEAKQFLENNLLTYIAGNKLLEFFAPVRLLGAVVMAFCGEKAAALRELEEVRHLMSPSHQKELLHQEERIHKINRGEVVLNAPTFIPRIRSEGTRMLQGVDARSRPGRNSICPCGSGKKFKRCCGLS